MAVHDSSEGLFFLCIIRQSAGKVITCKGPSMKGVASIKYTCHDAHRCAKIMHSSTFNDRKKKDFLLCVDFFPAMGGQMLFWRTSPSYREFQTSACISGTGGDQPCIAEHGCSAGDRLEDAKQEQKGSSAFLGCWRVQSIRPEWSCRVWATSSGGRGSPAGP